MHEVAGRVGYLVTDLFALHAPDIAEQKDHLMPLSRECGLALQTVNVIRGIHKDYVRGWVFVPRTYLERFGLTQETMLLPHNKDKALGVVDLLANKADRHLENGLRYVCSFPRRHHSLRLSLMWPFFFAVRTLAISRNNPLVLSSEAKMSRDEVAGIVTQTRLFGWSNSWLQRYYEQMAGRPSEAVHARPMTALERPL
jgi:phytoene/squalene synthetase